MQVLFVRTKKTILALFNNKEWETSTVLLATLNDLTHIYLDFLKRLNDIYTFEDLEKSN